MEINTVQSRDNQPRDQLDIACRFADNIDATFGAGKRDAVPEHREIELALVELVRESSQPRHLALAAFFIGKMNGCTPSNPAHHLDRVPVREADVAEGHAVRHLYLLDLRIRSNAPPKLIWQEGLLGKLLGIKPQRTVEAMTNWDGALHGSLPSASPQQQDCELTAISDCAWANRGQGTMRVWLPCL